MMIFGSWMFSSTIVSRTILPSLGAAAVGAAGTLARLSPLNMRSISAFTRALSKSPATTIERLFEA